MYQLDGVVRCINTLLSPPLPSLDDVIRLKCKLVYAIAAFSNLVAFFVVVDAGARVTSQTADP